MLRRNAPAYTMPLCDSAEPWHSVFWFSGRTLPHPAKPRQNAPARRAESAGAYCRALGAVDLTDSIFVGIDLSCRGEGEVR